MNAGAVPGWYPDPLLRADFRYWDGGEWTPVVSDGTTASTDARPPPPLGLRGPSTYPAPVVRRAAAPPPPPLAPAARRGSSSWWYAAGAVLGALAVVGWLSLPERGGPGGTHVPAGATSASSCVALVLDRHGTLLDAARGTSRGYEAFSLGGNEAYRDFGRRLRALPLDGCPREFEPVWSQYVDACEGYGQWVEDHTGFRRIFNGPDEPGRDEHRKRVEAAYAKVVDIAQRYLPGRQPDRWAFD